MTDAWGILEGMAGTMNTPQTFTITWHEDDTCWVATSNHHSLFSGHGDTPEEALSELQMAIAERDELMIIATQFTEALQAIDAVANAKTTPPMHTIAALHITYSGNDAYYIVGYLIDETPESITIAKSIGVTNGIKYNQQTIERSHIKQCYSLPVTWW